MPTPRSLSVAVRGGSKVAAPLFCLSLALVTPGVAAPAAQPEPVAGFDLCWASPPPTCAGKDEVYRDEAQTKACQDEVSRFVNSTFAYRSCLERQIQRAVSQANITIDNFKCGMDAKHICIQKELPKVKKPKKK
jgi:hypothetical protein